MDFEKNLEQFYLKLRKPSFLTTSLPKYNKNTNQTMQRSNDTRHVKCVVVEIILTDRIYFNVILKLKACWKL
jgi:hypothetical protein